MLLPALGVVPDGGGGVPGGGDGVVPGGGGDCLGGVSGSRPGWIGGGTRPTSVSGLGSFWFVSLAIWAAQMLSNDPLNLFAAGWSGNAVVK